MCYNTWHRKNKCEQGLLPLTRQFSCGVFPCIYDFFIGQIVLSPSQKLDVRQVPHPRDGVRAG
nr:MAG TPA: hypothetical protein [Caudoviricetes sp.]